MKKRLLHIPFIFPLVFVVLFVSCRNVSRLQERLEEKVDEVRVIIKVGNITKRIVEEKQLTIKDRHEIRTLCYIAGDQKKDRMACAHTGYIDYLLKGEKILTLQFTLNCKVVVNRNGLIGFSRNLTDEGHRILKGYCDDLLKQLGPDWHCANSEMPGKGKQ